MILNAGGAAAAAGGGETFIPVSTTLVNANATGSKFSTIAQASGKGVLDITVVVSSAMYTDRQKAKVTVDGVVIANSTPVAQLGKTIQKQNAEFHTNGCYARCCTFITIPFKKSIKFELYGQNADYSATAQGTLFLCE